MITIKLKDGDVRTFKATTKDGHEIKRIDSVDIKLRPNERPVAEIKILIDELELELISKNVYKDLSGNEYIKIND